MYPSHHLQ